MFVRWKKRAFANEKNRYSMSACLVESVRVDGKPRQKLLAHLCTFDSKEIEKEHPGCWCSIEEKLVELNLDEATKERIYQAIEQKTPRPSKEKIAAVRKDRAGWAAYFANIVVVPDIPPQRPDRDTTREGDTELPFYISWKVDQPRPGAGVPAKYHASLARKNDAGSPEIIAKLASIDATELGENSRLRWAWMDFWYQVHCSLCLAHVDKDTYQKVLQLLDVWIMPPTEAEYIDIITRKVRYQDSELKRERKTYHRALMRTYDKQDRLAKVIEQSRTYFKLSKF